MQGLWRNVHCQYNGFCNRSFGNESCLIPPLYPALSRKKKEECLYAGHYIKILLEKRHQTIRYYDTKAFENALRLIIVLGGSTNAVLHFIAIAKVIGVKLTIDDFQKISDETPFVADLKPSGKYLMEDFHNVGGVPAVMKYLLDLGLSSRRLPYGNR